MLQDQSNCFVLEWWDCNAPLGTAAHWSKLQPLTINLQPMFSWANRWCCSTLWWQHLFSDTSPINSFTGRWSGNEHDKWAQFTESSTVWPVNELVRLVSGNKWLVHFYFSFPAYYNTFQRLHCFNSLLLGTLGSMNIDGLNYYLTSLH